LPGIERFLHLLARTGMPAVPAGISENGRLILRFGPIITASELLRADDAALLTMQRIADLI
jgi:hypothetical protein